MLSKLSKRNYRESFNAKDERAISIEEKHGYMSDHTLYPDAEDGLLKTIKYCTNVKSSLPFCRIAMDVLRYTNVRTSRIPNYFKDQKKEANDEGK
jgi:hypothetical protein